MTLRRFIMITVGLAAGTFVPATRVGAQNRIDPAPTVRVVETVDGFTGQLVRWAVDDPTPAEILRVQVELAAAGFDPGVRSGVIDAPTRQALLDFQTARGLVICGCLSYETILALTIRPEIVAAEDIVRERDVPYGGARRRDVGDRYAGGRDVVVVVPFFHLPRKHPGRHLPGVVVGHEPAVGAGELARRRSPISVGVREINPAPRPPGGGIRMAPRSPTDGSRPPRPRP